jgi:hypothetical protein
MIATVMISIVLEGAQRLIVVALTSVFNNDTEFNLGSARCSIH